MPSFVTIDYNKAQLKEMAEGEFLTVPTGAIFTVRPSVFNVSPEPRGILVENRDQITVFFYVTGTMPVGTAVELEFFAKSYPRPLGSVIKTMVVGATDAMVQFDITDDLLGEADFVQITYKFKQGTAYTVSQLLTNIKKFYSDETLASLVDIESNTAASAASLAIIDDAIGTHDVAAAALLRGMRLLGNATAALQTAVTAAGDDAKINTDLSGQVRLASHVIGDIADSGKEIDPISSHYLPATILFSDEAVVADPGASYAPDATGHALTYGHVAAVQLYLRGGTGGGPVDRTVTVTIEGSMGLLIAAAVRWVDVSKLVLNLNTGLSDVASWTSTGVTATEYLLSLGNVPFSHFRIKYDWDGAPDNTDGIIVVNAFKSAL